MHQFHSNYSFTTCWSQPTAGRGGCETRYLGGRFSKRWRSRVLYPMEWGRRWNRLRPLDRPDRRQRPRAGRDRHRRHRRRRTVRCHRHPDHRGARYWAWAAWPGTRGFITPGYQSDHTLASCERDSGRRTQRDSGESGNSTDLCQLLGPSDRPTRTGRPWASWTVRVASSRRCTTRAPPGTPAAEI
jgi:hypothetical protein